jgi:hypothetical protein
MFIYLCSCPRRGAICNKRSFTSTHASPRHGIYVSGQLHAPRERNLVLLALLSGPHRWSGRFRRREKSVAFTGNRILDCPPRGIVTIPTPLAWLYLVFLLLVYLITLSVAQYCKNVEWVEVFTAYCRSSTVSFLSTFRKPRKLSA